MYSHLLCLNVRPENQGDFSAIAHKVQALAPHLGVLGRTGDLAWVVLPPDLQALPRLSVYLVNPPSSLPDRGAVLSVTNFGKHEEYLSYVRQGVRTPKTRMLAELHTIDAADWGERVIIKPDDDSYGRSVALVETSMLDQCLRSRNAEYDRLVQRGFMVQEFVDTGRVQDKFRVIVFLGQVILSYRVVYRSSDTLPRYTSLTQAIQANYFVGTPEMGLRYQLVIDPEVNAFAQAVYQANPDCPVQGLDIQRDKHGQLFVIENNSGGNVWKFSDRTSSPYQIFGPSRMQAQYKAWDVCAQALVKATRELAC